MVMACKIFELADFYDLNLIAMKIKNYRITEIGKLDDKEIELMTMITDLRMHENILSGSYVEDQIVTVNFRGVEKPIPITKATLFEFLYYKEKIYLIVVDKKDRANRIANIFSQIIAGDRFSIIEAKLSHETLKSLHESNPEATKVIFFDQVDIPNINKLSLYGPSIADTSLYLEYLKHGKIWYVVFRSENNMVIGLTRNCVVTLFSKASLNDFLEFVHSKIIPLIE